MPLILASLSGLHSEWSYDTHLRYVPVWNQEKYWKNSLNHRLVHATGVSKDVEVFSKPAAR